MNTEGLQVIAVFLIVGIGLAVLFDMKKPKLNQLYQLFKETMKKLFLIIILLMSAICSYSQETGKTSKKDTTKVKYQYFARVPASDYQTVANSLNEYKRLQIYDPNTTDAQKVQLFKNIEAYLKSLPERVKIDSVKVK